MTGPTKPAISLRRVSRWYGPVIGVNRVSLDVRPGITGLLGPNGAGKSTLMRLIVGYLRPTLGEVRVAGRDVWRSAAARRKLGFAPDGDAFHERMPGRQFVYSMARLAGLSGREAETRTAECLELTGIAARADTKLGACSRGMKQRIKLAQALVHDPEVLVLDEPLSGIDPPSRREFLGLFARLRDEGKTLLISSHILHEIQAVADRLVLIGRGRILAAGTLRELRALLDQYPLTVRVNSDERRALARALLAMDSVVGVSLGASYPGELVVKVERPEAFFRALPGAILEAGGNVDRVETLDASAEAIFRYLIEENARIETDGER